MVGLAERANSKVKTFSQGMKQRLGIAVALIHNPKLIVLDEPTNGLDPQGIADMRNLILRLSKEMGKTVVVSSHLLSEIEIIANRILIINRGKKVVEGSKAELFDPAQTVVELDSVDPDHTEALLQGGAILAQQLGSRVGIEDVSLESDLTNETSLVLGKYLSPRVYVSYGVSLTQQLNTLKLRYSLGDHWTVKTEVGQARGADLVFGIDR